MTTTVRSRRALLRATDAPTQWPAALGLLAGAVAGWGAGRLAGWDRSALLAALAGALVCAAGAAAPPPLRLRLAWFAGVVGGSAIWLATVTSGHPVAAAAAMAAVAVCTSALAAAGPLGATLGTVGLLAFATAVSLLLVASIGEDVSPGGAAARVGLGVVVGLALVQVLRRVRGEVAGGRSDARLLVARPWQAMWTSLTEVDEHAREGIRRGLALGLAMYLLQHDGTRTGLWTFLGALAVLSSPVRLGPPKAAVRVAATLVAVVLLGALSLVLPVWVLVAVGAASILPAVAYTHRHPMLAGVLTGVGAIVLAGAPDGSLDTWASRRLVDTLLGCAFALTAQSLLWPRDRATAG